ncbi:MAG: hypothetical protein IJ731_02165 [Eubacterium sp.]|nr:hypothetical protein [Eubacterium sp.]
MILTKETLKRAGRTFIQAMISYLLVVVLPNIDFSNDKKTLKAFLLGGAVSALSAGISAIMNLEKGEGNDL